MCVCACVFVWVCVVRFLVVCNFGWGWGGCVGGWGVSRGVGLYWNGENNLLHHNAAKKQCQ